MEDIKINYLNNIYHIKTYEDISSFLIDNDITYEIKKDKTIIENLNEIFKITLKEITRVLIDELLYESFILLNDIDEKLSILLKMNIDTKYTRNEDDYELTFNFYNGLNEVSVFIIYTERKNGELYITNILTK